MRLSFPLSEFVVMTLGLQVAPLAQELAHFLIIHKALLLNLISIPVPHKSFVLPEGEAHGGGGEKKLIGVLVVLHCRSDYRHLDTTREIKDEVLTNTVSVEYPVCLAGLAKTEPSVVLEFYLLSFHHVITSPFLEITYLLAKDCDSQLWGH